MTSEAEIRIEKTQEYLGLWVDDSTKTPRKLTLKFSPINLENLKIIGDLEKLCIGYEVISAGEFRKEYLPRADVVLNKDDARPTTWSIYREY